MQINSDRVRILLFDKYNTVSGVTFISELEVEYEENFGYLKLCIDENIKIERIDIEFLDKKCRRMIHSICNLTNFSNIDNNIRIKLALDGRAQQNLNEIIGNEYQYYLKKEE
ncbi:MAG: hypothetical protein ACOCRX_07560 [Candidatus Woesearchaeota archaeon]